MEAVNQHKAVMEQYKTPDNLNARISIHAKYSLNKLGFGNWLFEHYSFCPDNKVLELGCGTGDMWSSRLDPLDYIYSLSDMSSVCNIERKTPKEILEKETVNGVLHIPKEYGTFICRK